MAKAKVTLDGQEIELDITGKCVLDALIDAGYDPPFSCTSGVCTTCMAKMTTGSVEMDQNYGLDEAELDEGYILTCQARPTSDEVVITYDF